MPTKGLTADENVKIITALIVSDEVYSEYVNPDTVTVYHNFCIPSETVEADGLMVSIMEARDLLKPSGCTAKAFGQFRTATILCHFRQLHDLIHGFYASNYRLRPTCPAIPNPNARNKGKVCDTFYSGRTTRTNEAFYKPTGAMVFSAPLFPACISGTVGICAMQHYLYSNMAKLQQSYPMLLVYGRLSLFVMLALYGVAIARTANREISKLNWKPNA